MLRTLPGRRESLAAAGTETAESFDARPLIKRALWSCAFPFLVIGLLSASINLLALASPLYMLQLYDRVLSSRSVDTLIYLTAIVFGALGLLAVLEGCRRACLARVATWLDDHLSRHVLCRTVEGANTQGGRDAGPKDLAVLRQFLCGPAITPIMDAPWSPIFLIALFLLHPHLGLVGVAGILVLTALAIANQLLTRRPLEAANTAAMRGDIAAQAIVRNADVVKAMGMLDGVAGEWWRQSTHASRLLQSASDRASVVMAISRFLRLAVQCLVMGVGAWIVIDGAGTAGLIFASSFLLSRSLAPVENMIGTWSAVVQARQAYRNLVAADSAVTDRIRMALPAPQGDVAVEGLTYVLPGCRAATLHDLNFSVRSGEALAIIGPTAAGKSTLARLLAGVLSPTDGNVRLDQADLHIWQGAAGAGHIGYLPQDIELFAGSIGANIARFRPCEPEEVIQAATLAGLHDTIMRFPDGYDTEIGEGGVKLSGGLRQRVGLARAVFGLPRLMVLDEPNASLDGAGELALDALIKWTRDRGTTTVIVSHRPRILELCDKVLFLRAGRIEAFGTRDAVVAMLSAARNIPASPTPMATGTAG